MKSHHYVILLLCLSTAVLDHAVLSIDLHRSFWADYNQYNHKLNVALTWYNKLLSKQNAPGYMYRGLLHLLQQTHNIQQILALMPKLDASLSDDVEMQLLFAHILEQTGNQAAADQKFLKLLTIAKENQQVAFYAAQVFLRKKEPENALSTIQDYVANSTGHPTNFIFHFLAAQIYLQLNKKEDAIKQIALCLSLHPTFDKGWLMYALLHEQNDMLEQAIHGYTTYLQINKTSLPHIKEHIMRLALKQQMMAQNPFFYNEQLTQALHLFKRNNYTQALMLINQYVMRHPRDNEAKLFKIQTLTAMGNIKQAINETLHWIKQNPQQELWFELLHLIAVEHKYELTVARALTMLQQTYPHELHIALYLADVATRSHDIIEAVAQHYKALALTQDAALQAKIFAHIISIYYEYKLYDQMKTLIAQAEALKHEHAPLFNALAYWYAAKGNNHIKAHQYIKQALALGKHNSFLLDTIAKLYYKQGMFNEAILLLRQGIRYAPGEATLLKHLVKCYALQTRQYALSPLMKNMFLEMNQQII